MRLEGRRTVESAIAHVAAARRRDLEATAEADRRAHHNELQANVRKAAEACRTRFERAGFPSARPHTVGFERSRWQQRLNRSKWKLVQRDVVAIPIFKRAKPSVRLGEKPGNRCKPHTWFSGTVCLRHSPKARISQTFGSATKRLHRSVESESGAPGSPCPASKRPLVAIARDTALTFDVATQARRTCAFDGDNSVRQRATVSAARTPACGDMRRSARALVRWGLQIGRRHRLPASAPRASASNDPASRRLTPRPPRQAKPPS